MYPAWTQTLMFVDGFVSFLLFFFYCFFGFIVVCLFVFFYAGWMYETLHEYNL